MRSKFVSKILFTGWSRWLSGLPLYVLLSAFLFSCINEDKKQDNGARPGDISMDCQVWGDEESGLATVKVEFISTGGTISHSLSGNNLLTIDGEQMKEDSSSIGGVYYEWVSPVADFGGPHQVIYKTGEKEEFKIDFDFPFFTLADTLAAVLIRTDTLVLGLKGLPDESAVRVHLFDTSFVNSGLEKLDTLQGQRLLLTPADFGRVASGPVRLEIYRETERRLTSKVISGGRLRISYSLGRNFQLKD